MGDTTIILKNLQIKPSEKIITYNIEFMRYVFQLSWGDNVL